MVANPSITGSLIANRVHRRWHTGRLIDLMERRMLNLSSIKFVVNEADRM